MRVSLGIGSVDVKGDQMNRYLGRVAQSRSTLRFGEFTKFSDSLPDEGATPTVIRRRLQSRHRADEDIG
jgi:hypothetical protein